MKLRKVGSLPKHAYLSWCVLLSLVLAGCGGWAKSYGGIDVDWAFSIQQTKTKEGGGYIVSGFTRSTGAGSFADVWVLALNAGGSVAWQKRYGGTGFDDGANSIQQTSDGGYIVAGYTESFGAGNRDAWILKLKDDGSVAWQKAYGGTGFDEARSIQQTSDGGYIVAGATNSFGAGSSDVWVLKLDPDGTVLWQKAYGGTGNDVAYSIQQTSDGGYIVAGITASFGAGRADFWVLKLKDDGSVLWQKAYGGTGGDVAYSIQQTSDGGYIVAGTTASFDVGSEDAWVLKLTPNGKVTWVKAYGGIGFDGALSIHQTSDGGYIVAGYTESFGAGFQDALLLKLKGDGTGEWGKAYGGKDLDQARSILQTSGGGYIVAGSTTSFGAGLSDIWVLKLDPDGKISFNPNSGAQITAKSFQPFGAHNTSTHEADTSVTGTGTTATSTNTNATIGATNATIKQQAP